MASVELVHPSETRTIPRQRLQDTCVIFQQDPALLDRPYTLKSKIELEIFHDFLAALEDRPLTITQTNFPGLLRLCDEFGFDDLSERLSEFLRDEDRELRRRVLSLEEGELFREQQVRTIEAELARGAGSASDMSSSLNYALDRIARLEMSIGALTSEVDGLNRMEAARQGDVGALQRSLAAVQARPAPGK
jgi:hypothetical protein